MRIGTLVGGMGLFLVFGCAGAAPRAAENPTPQPPPRLDFKVLPGPYSPVPPDITRRFPMTIVEVDPSQFPMPVTQGRVGTYPIRIIPPGDVDHPASGSRILRLTPAQPARVPLSRPRK